MKCPKCRYLGFETGDRCRNCGYDFSLLTDPGADTAGDPEPADQPDLRLRDETVRDEPEPPLDLSLRAPVSGPVVEAPPALPLFLDDEEPEDEPLVRVTAPRAPIAVRKTPDARRLRFPRPLGGDGRFEDSVLEFGAEPEPTGDETPDSAAEARRSWGIDSMPVSAAAPADALELAAASPMAARLTAALIDFGLLFGIDAVVIHFTLRLTSLTLEDWRLIPLTPLLVFLVGLKLTYLSAFTLAGGQTIGKMATRIRVVSDGETGPDLSQSVRRAVVEVASLVAAGIPFLLALVDPARRGLHDRVAHTRVVALS